MLWTSLLLFGIAVAFWRLLLPHPNHLISLTGVLVSIASLTVALATAPILLPTLTLLGLLLVSPICMAQPVLRERHTCSKLCMLRNRCYSYRKHFNVSVSRSTVHRQSAKGGYGLLARNETGNR
ncbi:MAG: hypothetical protein AAF974_02335 [Cyanobacteria bacterium P01_E01_bin.34]